MEPYRFFLPDIHAGGGELPSDQAHHARHVLRLANGDPAIVFDGRGHWAAGEIELKSAGVVAVRCGSVRQSPRTGPLLTLATAVPKLDRADFLVEAAGQLNVDAIQWLDCQRSVVKPDVQGKKMEKWRRLALESAKQCGRLHLLRIEPLQPVVAVLRARAGEWVLWADTQADMSMAKAWNRWQENNGGGGKSQPPPRITVFIGPEGGWTDAEAKMFRDGGACNVRLGLHILRIEIAALAAAAFIGCGETPCPE